MKFERITVELKRTIRHRPYVISEPKISLTGSFEDGDDEEEAIVNLSADVRYFLDRMEIEENHWYEKQKKEKEKEKG